MVYIDAAIKNSNNNTTAALGYVPGLRSLDFCQSPLQVKICVIGDIHGLSYTVNLYIINIALHLVGCYLRGPLPFRNCNYLSSNLRKCRFKISAHALIYFSDIARACAWLEFDDKTFRRWIPLPVTSG